MRNDKNHLTSTVDNMACVLLKQQQQQSMDLPAAPLGKLNIQEATEAKKNKEEVEEEVKEKEQKIKASTITSTMKKYSVSTNDLSQPVVHERQLSPLTSSYTEDQKQYVLITPDAPLITVHGAKCVQNSVEMALEAKSASASPLSSTMSLTTCSSQCNVCTYTSNPNKATGTTIKKTSFSSSSIYSNLTSSPSSSSSSTSSGIFTSIDDYQSSSFISESITTGTKTSMMSY